jgi:phosphoserine aminotransferase
MNFNPGPSTLFPEVLQGAADELLDFQGTGMSIIEHSHRGAAYGSVHKEAIALVTSLLGVPESHQVLFLSGGASMQFAMLPLNFLHSGQSADYITTGTWSVKALAEAKTVGEARSAFDGERDGWYREIPTQEQLQLDPGAAYVHLTSNNTVYGSQWFDFPDTAGVPLVADMSSDIFWRPIDVGRFGLIYAGAQKNMGPSGVTLVIVKKDLLARARTDIPKILRYRTHAESDSLYNTPPSFAVYLVRGVLRRLAEAGGLAEMERRNRHKASVLYEALDARPDLYNCPVDAGSRSLMNAVFKLPTPEADARFVEQAQQRGCQGIRGHKSVGGLRVSIYNAVPLEWVEALADFAAKFQL